MNRKGIMLYELVVSFFILSIIAIFLLNTIFNYKDKNERARTVSQIVVFKANVTGLIQKDLKNLKPTGTIVSGNVTSFIDGTGNNRTIKLSPDLEKVLKVDKDNGRLTYGDYVQDLPEGARFSGDMSVEQYNAGSGDNRYIIVITIPIFHEDLDDEGNLEGKYTIKIVYSTTFVGS